MVEIKYPERETQNFKIIWENDWIYKIENLPEGKFFVFDNEDIRWFEKTCSNEEIELVILIDYKNKKILKIRSLSPCIYSEEFRELILTPEDIERIDKEWQEIVKEMPKHMAEIDEEIALRENLEKIFPNKEKEISR